MTKTEKWCKKFDYQEKEEIVRITQFWLEMFESGRHPYVFRDFEQEDLEEILQELSATE